MFFAPLRDIPPLWGRNGARENRGSSRSAVSSPIYSEQDAGPTQVLRAGGGHAARSRSTRWSSRRFVSLGKEASRQRGDRRAGCRRRVKRRWAKAPNRSAPWVRAPVGEIARRGVARTQIARTQIAVAQNRRGLKARGRLEDYFGFGLESHFSSLFSRFANSDRAHIPKVSRLLTARRAATPEGRKEGADCNTDLDTITKLSVIATTRASRRS